MCHGCNKPEKPLSPCDNCCQAKLAKHRNDLMIKMLDAAMNMEDARFHGNVSRFNEAYKALCDAFGKRNTLNME